MIDIVVVAYNGASAAAIVGHFDELGGNIGRAENNQLVLPDPERSISRVHAQVVFRNGRYAVVDRGSTPIAVNGRPLGNGQEALIQAGDELQVGGYTLRVEAGKGAGGAAAADPFADFAGLAAGGGGSAPAGRAAARPAAAAAPFADPLAGFGAPPAAARGPAGAPPAAPSAAGGIPADWDPFAPDAPAAGSGNDLARSLGQPQRHNLGLEVGGRADALIPDFAPGNSGGGGGDSLDALFGLGGGSGGGDPFAGSALNEAAAQPNMAAHADPLKSLNSMTRGVASAAPDRGSELGAPFQIAPMVPQAGRPAQAPAAPPRAAQPPVVRAAQPQVARAAAPPMPPARALPQAPPQIQPPMQPARAGSVAPPRAAPPPQPPVAMIPPTSFHSGFGNAADFPPPATPAPRAPAAPQPRVSEQAAPPGSVLSWNDPSGESRTVIRPRGAAPAPEALLPPDDDTLDLALDFDTPAPTPAQAPPPASMAQTVLPPATPPRAAPLPPPPAPAAPRAAPAAPAPPQRPTSMPTAAAGSGGSTPAWRPPPGTAPPAGGHGAASNDIAALTAALREGLAAPGIPPENLVLTPALMRLMGRLVHEATRGTVDLLVARAALKREIRAEVTMIVTKENNPLKFSPSADVALGHLLGPPQRGFMPSDKAMRDAYDDLRAHQFGFLAGMRAALEGILKRFDPASLESKLTQKSRLSALLPAKRKAQMWDVFTELYGQISSEASDDFHELFGKEFLRAYNEYIDQLDNERR